MRKLSPVKRRSFPSIPQLALGQAEETGAPVRVWVAAFYLFFIPCYRCYRLPFSEGCLLKIISGMGGIISKEWLGFGAGRV